MKRKPAARRVLKSLCGAIGPGDGEDPKWTRSGSAPSSAGRKTRQLCAQAAEALAYALASLEDPALMSLLVVRVEPAPDTSRLMATLAPAEGPELWDPADLLSRLEHATPLLRSEVARSITRRRAPSLAFRLQVG